jgi:regulator of RNase E activity RraA
MKLVLCFSALFLWAIIAAAQGPRPVPPDAELRNGATLIPVAGMTEGDPLPLVKQYEGLRVTDVVDALQAIGLQDTTSMDFSIRPLWRDVEKMTHRIYGVAVTAQYVPTNKPPAREMPIEQFRKWHSEWYRDTAPELFSRLVRPGTVVVIDAHDVDNVGFIGSNNALGWKSKGMAGVVTNGGCRDTDEIMLEKIPVYSKYISHGTRPGRIETATINQPVSVGGALVRPGDMVVADGDGVVVVPREHAGRVAEIAWSVAKGDKAGRKQLYEKMKMPLDPTVK